MVQSYKKDKDINVMIWDVIYEDGRSDVIIMDRDPDSEKSGYTVNSYLTVLNDQLSRTWQPGMTFMQDNARIHTAKKVKKWFEDEGIPVMEWPPYSPDLNPIEHLWVQLKQWILDHYPELNEMDESEEAYQRLFQVICEGWEAIAQDVINDLIKSMDTRVNSVIRAKGWYIRFWYLASKSGNQYSFNEEVQMYNILDFQRLLIDFPLSVVICMRSGRRSGGGWMRGSANTFGLKL